ncbi:hypothetical protein [Gracilimonas sp.]|uniref:hypothetical protein n=1 Tax=Gracilimonas sp. TaxID=1974203 RepID=UPI0032EE0490
MAVAALLAFTTACSDNSTGSNGSSNNPQSFSVKGELSGYDHGEQELYQAEDFVDLIDGTINADGTFTVEFLGEEAVQEALKPLSDDSEGFVSMYCRNAVRENLDDGHQFVGLSVFNFTYGEETNVGGIGLSSGAPNRNVYPPSSDFRGEYQVRWIYSTHEATISEECDSGSGGTEEVEIELMEGWNEVIFNVSDGERLRMYTGERPSEVGWTLET